MGTLYKGGRKVSKSSKRKFVGPTGPDRIRNVKNLSAIARANLHKAGYSSTTGRKKSRTVADIKKSSGGATHSTNSSLMPPSNGSPFSGLTAGTLPTAPSTIFEGLAMGKSKQEIEAALNQSVDPKFFSGQPQQAKEKGSAGQSFFWDLLGRTIPAYNVVSGFLKERGTGADTALTDYLLRTTPGYNVAKGATDENLGVLREAIIRSNPLAYTLSSASDTREIVRDTAQKLTTIKETVVEKISDVGQSAANPLGAIWDNIKTPVIVAAVALAFGFVAAK